MIRSTVVMSEDSRLGKNCSDAALISEKRRGLRGTGQHWERATDLQTLQTVSPPVSAGCREAPVMFSGSLPGLGGAVDHWN
jgi:hypothetical protein